MRSLRTRDPQVAERTLRSALVGLDREFALKAARLREERRLPRQQRVTTLALGQMLARGDTRSIIPAMYGFLTLCGIDARLSVADEQQAGYAFLEAVVTALDHQAQRQRGRAVSTVAVTSDAQPLHTWEQVFVV